VLEDGGHKMGKNVNMDPLHSTFGIVKGGKVGGVEKSGSPGIFCKRWRAANAVSMLEKEKIAMNKAKMMQL